MSTENQTSTEGSKGNEGMDREYLKDLSKTIEHRIPDGHGFILIVVPMLKESPRVHYTSSLQRPSAIQVMKTLLFHWGEGENWMKHIR